MAGRPQSNINWDEVDVLLVAGCSGRQIAGNIGISTDTLYDRCLIDKGVQFSQYSQQKNEKGESLLKAHQFAKALGKTTDGDNTLLIWLGKTRLKQAEHRIEQNVNLTITPEQIKQIKESNALS